jgi:hypothetical protein
MANIFQRLLSKATFWDQNDDTRIAQEDEEERRRKNMLAVSSAALQRPTYNPSASQFDFTKPLQAASQGDTSNKMDQPLQQKSIMGSQSQFNLEKPKPIEPPKDTRSDVQKELDRLAAENLDKAREDSSKGENWFTKTFLNGKAIEERAVSQARNRATQQYQEKHGWNRNPEVLKYNSGTMDRLNVESARLKKDTEDLDKFSGGMDKAAEVLSYVPIAGSVFNLGLAGTEKLAKATGNEAYGKDLEDARIRVDFGMEPDEFNRLDEETKQKLRNLQGLGLALSPLDFVGVGGLAKSGAMSVGKKAIIQQVKEGAVDAATKAALKKALISEGKAAAIPTVVGAGASVGAQAYLGGAENIDPLEALKTGALVGGTSLLFPSQGIRKAGDEAVESAVKKSVGAIDSEAPQISTLKKASEAADEVEDGIEVADGVKSTNMAKAPEDQTGVKPPAAEAPRVPDVTNPIALAKADDDLPAVSAPATQQEIPIADFSKAINAPLQKADPATEAIPTVNPNTADVAQAAAQGELRMPTRTDADVYGNETLTSDAQVARDLAEEGIAPQRGGSQVDAVEGEMLSAAERAAADEVALTGAAAPRTRARITGRIEDEQLRADLNADVPALDRVSLPEAEANAKSFINDLSDEALIGRFADEVKVSTPEGFYAALNGIRRLEQIDVPESQMAIRNALDAMTNYASESGRGLRTAQIVFEDMPTTMKADYLINKIQKAGANMDDASRAELLARIQRSDKAADDVRALEAEAQQILDSGVINNRSLSPEVQTRAAELSDAINEADRVKELAQGDAWRFYQESLPKTSAGKRVGDVGRTLMLSSPTGRVFDVMSTAATTTDDILTRGVSSTIGKVVNKFTDPGTVKDTGFSGREFARGGMEGVQDIIDSFKGRGRVESILDESNRNSRGDVNTGGGRIRNAIRTLVEAPTNLTRGIRNDELYRSGMQEAAKLGLQGDAQTTYARLRASVPSEDQLHAAEQSWKKANMLHDNPVSRALNNVANSLDKKGGGWASPIIRNQIAPFTSWLGGNLHRTLTDKNVLWNAGSAINNVRKGNLQGVIDDVSKFAVNSGEALALGYLLTEAGVVTTEDANGDSYGGLYFHIGDRYIPVAIAGTAAVPIILGNAANQGMKEGGDLATMVNALGSNTLKNAGVASVFGGDNNFQSAIAEATQEGGNLLDAVAQYTGGVFRQYIPGLTSDVNSILDQTDLNPTGEAAETKVTNENPETGRQVTDVLATEVNKTLNRIPGASQMLDRKEGVPAKDLLDRMLKSTRETGDMAEQREKTQSLADIKKDFTEQGVPLKAEDIEFAAESGEFDKAIMGSKYRLAEMEADENASEKDKARIREDITKYGLEKDGIPTTQEGVKARMEEGEYDKVVRGLQYSYSKIENDDDVAASTKKELRNQIGRTEIYRDANYEPEVVQAYEASSADDGGIGVTAWRDMMDSNDPEAVKYAKELATLDQKLLKAGLIKKAKYYYRGGGSGGRGGSKGPAFNTSIATQSFAPGGGFDPQKPLAADFATPKSAIPVLQRVPNNDQSFKKEIKVSRGGRS